MIENLQAIRQFAADLQDALPFSVTAMPELLPHFEQDFGMTFDKKQQFPVSAVHCDAEGHIGLTLYIDETSQITVLLTYLNISLKHPLYARFKTYRFEQAFQNTIGPQS